MRDTRLKILFLAARPKLGERSRLDHELRAIAAKIEAAKHRDSFELVSSWAVTPASLVKALLDTQPHIVHFSGRGTETEALVLENERGEDLPLSKETLRDLISALKDNIRLVVLNACHCRPQAEAIVEHVDYAVGMSRALSDEVAITFAAAFYQAIAYGRSIENALELGKVALKAHNIPGADIPELLVRTGADPKAALVATSSPPPELKPSHPKDSSTTQTRKTEESAPPELTQVPPTSTATGPSNLTITQTPAAVPPERRHLPAILLAAFVIACIAVAVLTALSQPAP